MKQICSFFKAGKMTKIMLAELYYQKGNLYQRRRLRKYKHKKKEVLKPPFLNRTLFFWFITLKEIDPNHSRKSVIDGCKNDRHYDIENHQKYATYILV